MKILVTHVVTVSNPRGYGQYPTWLLFCSKAYNYSTVTVRVFSTRRVFSTFSS